MPTHLAMIRAAAAAALLHASAAPAVRAADPPAPPLSGPVEPRATPVKGDDGLYHQPWFVQAVLDLGEDPAAARSKGFWARTAAGSRR